MSSAAHSNSDERKTQFARFSHIRFFAEFVLWMKLLNKKIDRLLVRSFCYRWSCRLVMYSVCVCVCVRAARLCACLHSRQNCRPMAATKFTVPAVDRHRYPKRNEIK